METIARYVVYGENKEGRIECWTGYETVYGDVKRKRLIGYIDPEAVFIECEQEYWFMTCLEHKAGLLHDSHSNIIIRFKGIPSREEILKLFKETFCTESAESPLSFILPFDLPIDVKDTYLDLDHKITPIYVHVDTQDYRHDWQTGYSKVITGSEKYHYTIHSIWYKDINLSIKTLTHEDVIKLRKDIGLMKPEPVYPITCEEIIYPNSLEDIYQTPWVTCLINEKPITFIWDDHLNKKISFCLNLDHVPVSTFLRHMETHVWHDIIIQAINGEIEETTGELLTQNNCTLVMGKFDKKSTITKPFMYDGVLNIIIPRELLNSAKHIPITNLNQLDDILGNFVKENDFNW